MQCFNAAEYRLSTISQTLASEVQVGIGRLADKLGVCLGRQHVIKLLSRIKMVKDDLDRVRLERPLRQVQPCIDDL
jgi:hypothetical protein